MEERVQWSPIRFLPFIPALLVLILVGAAAIAPKGASAPEGACEPQSWLDWHVALKRGCVTRTYVCHNMTPGRLLEDPSVVEAYERAIAEGDRARIAEIDALIGRIRAAYQCTDPRREPHRAAPPSPALPPGHPPIDRAPGIPIREA